jgi:3-hydroxyisobutyrate dehydrogenase-like beta-hydroxyacid dehydrogenase
LAAHDDVEFAGVWGRNETKAADLAERYGAAAYPSIDALIADVDAIAVALPAGRAGADRAAGRACRTASAAGQADRAGSGACRRDRSGL